MKLQSTFLATALAFTILPALPVLAHDDDYNYQGHESFHEQLDEAHERAHEQGFWSGAEHRAYHRALRDMHESAHDDHNRYTDYTGYYRPSYYYYSYPYPRYGYGWRSGW